MNDFTNQSALPTCERGGCCKPWMIATALLLGQVMAATGIAQPMRPGPGINRANPRVDVSALDLSLSSATGQVTFITGKDGAAINIIRQPGAAAAEPIDFLRQYGYLFGVRNVDAELVEIKKLDDAIGFTHTSYEQRYKGVPVFSGVLRVHQNGAGEFTAANGDFYAISDKLPATPTLTADQAVAIASADLGVAETTPELAQLVVVDPGWYGDRTMGAHLAFHVIIAKRNEPIREAYFVDAINGRILDRWDMIHRAINRQIYNGDFEPARFEGDPQTGNPEVDALYDYVGDAYFYFLRAFGRFSYDDNDAPIVGFADVQVQGLCPNAFWDGFQIVFCTGLATDDIVGHELTHAVTQFSANLIYQNQSGQLNESFSDVFGELIDLFNGNAAFLDPADNDIPWFDHPTGPGRDFPNEHRGVGCSPAPVYANGVRWLMGEDSTGFGGPIRDMWDPNCFGDPRDLNDGTPLTICHPFDSGGVHIGSGVGNHAFAMATDGKTYNGQVVSGIGPIKSGAVWYRALTFYLTPTSDYQDAYLAFNRAAEDLVGLTPDDPRTGDPSDSEFTEDDATQIERATLAVEMNTRGVCGAGLFHDLVVDVCERSILFQDDFEGADMGWSATTLTPLPPTNYTWVITGILPQNRPGSAWYFEDRNQDCDGPDESGQHVLTSPTFDVPANAPSVFVEFDHWVDTETSWDGGNLKVNVDDAGWEQIPLSAFLYNSYNTQIYGGTFQGQPINTNPMAGEEAFTGVGDRWATTVIDLTDIVPAGTSFQVRFDFGKDFCNGTDGWYVDDFLVYSCAPPITDCNDNTIPDECDIDCAPGECVNFPGCGASDDVNGNGVPDECDECVDDGDCDDGVACTVDSCNVDVCEFSPNDNACADDGVFCNGEEICDAVLGCVSDGNPCDAGFECDEDADKCNCLTDAACNDGLFCTGIETCDLDTGDCLNPGDPCDPGLFCDEQRNFCACDDNGDCADDYDCTSDLCDFNGVCLHIQDDGACADDGLFCNGVEVCCPDADFDFVCDPQTDPITGCGSTGDPCVDDGFSCDEGLGACVCNDNGDCDDGAYCTGVETCDAGECTSSGNPCQAAGETCNEAQNRCDCATDAYCDDGVFCNGAESCDGGQCDSGTAPCTDPDFPHCSEGLDACVECTLPAHCDDSQFCNGFESCGANGACVAGTAPCPGVLCNEIDDVCVQCVGAADCNDGLFCNGVESCNDGSCTSGTAPCTAGQVCNEANDTCDACDSDSDCSDGVFCNGVEKCMNGSCASGTPACPDECCNELTDDCVACQCTTVLDCDDDDPCTSDACTAGLCGNTPIDGCADTDRDGIADANDHCADTTPGLDVDANGCACNQRDTDSDGVNDCDDDCPNTTLGVAINAAGCSCSQIDDDGDGVDNCADTCPESAPGANVNATGCAAAQRDTDNDGVVDEGDACPDTPFGESVNTAGCSQSQLDSDADNVFNDMDRCPGTAAGAIVDDQGCAREQRDDDNDGVINADDACAQTPVGAAIDDVGCAQSQLDGDRDGVTNDIDVCPGTPVGQPVDEVGCAVIQVDADIDGVRNEIDLCPGTPRGAAVDASGCTVDQAVLAEIEAGAGVPDATGGGSGSSTTRSTGGANNGTCGVFGMIGLLGTFVALRSLQVIGGTRRRRMRSAS